MRQLLYEGVSVVGMGCVSRGDIYDVFGGLILVVLYYTNVISKVVICRKSVEVARIDNICCMRVSISLITIAMGRIKSQSCHVIAISCCNNIYIVFGDYFLLFRYRGL